jgi:hypothetical protein
MLLWENMSLTLCVSVTLHVFATWYACLVDIDVIRADVATGLAISELIRLQPFENISTEAFVLRQPV